MTATLTEPATADAGPRPAPVRFAAVLAAEWIKFTALRSTRATVAVGVLLGVGMSALIALIIGATWDGWPPAEQQVFVPAVTSLFGTVFTGIVFVVLGAKAVAAEYSSGMMRLTLTVTPHRGRVLAAKVLVVTAITLVAGTVATVGMFLAGQAVFGAYGVPTAGLADADALRAVLAISVLGPVFPVLAAATAAMVRSSAGSITAVIALLFAPTIFGGLLPLWWQEHVLSLLPGQATDSIAIGQFGDAPSYLTPGAAAVVLAGWLAVFLAVAAAMLGRRDA